MARRDRALNQDTTWEGLARSADNTWVTGNPRLEQKCGCAAQPAPREGRSLKALRLPRRKRRVRICGVPRILRRLVNTALLSGLSGGVIESGSGCKGQRPRAAASRAARHGGGAQVCNLCGAAAILAGASSTGDAALPTCRVSHPAESEFRRPHRLQTCAPSRGDARNQHSFLKRLSITPDHADWRHSGRHSGLTPFPRSP